MAIIEEMKIITKRAKQIIIRALKQFIVTQSYIVGKVDSDQKLEIHKDIEMAETLVKQLKILGEKIIESKKE